MTTNSIEAANIQSTLESFANNLNDSQFLPVDDPDFVKAVELIQVEKLSRKLKTEIKNISDPTRSEIKMLVNLYYQMQANRIGIREQIRAIENSVDSENKKMNVVVLDYMLKNMTIMESSCKNILQVICEQSEVGRWLLSITGIGPVLAAGCLAYFDVSHVQYSTQFISYAGLNDNNRPWIGKKGAEDIMKGITSNAWLTEEETIQFSNATQWRMDYLNKAYDEKKKAWSRDGLIKAAAKIPYNAELKTLMWKIGSSFQWLCGNEKSLYGQLYLQRKALETQKNEEGAYADQAKKILETKSIGKSTEAYKAYSVGKLPKAHITARAMRWVEKIFVSHLFEEMYRVYHKDDPNGNIPPRYWPLSHLEGQHNKEITPEIPYSR